MRELVLEQEVLSLKASVDDFEKALSAFVEWLQRQIPGQHNLSYHFRSTSYDKGDFATSKARKEWLAFWLKDVRTRFIRKSDLFKKK